MIVNKTAKHIGEYVEFSFTTPLRGLMTITSFTDSITGTSGTRFFDKEFRYTMDGARWSNWTTLTLLNLQAIYTGSLPIKNDFILEFRYIRAGTDTTGNLTVASFLLNGTYSLAYLQVLDFSNTVFKDIGFTDDYWNRVWVNLLNKLYKKGIVPQYILRDDDKFTDRDYIDYWKTVAYYFALTIGLVDEKITKIRENQEDLAEFLIERGAFVTKTDSIGTLNIVASEIYDIIRRRATQGISYVDGDFNTPLTNPEHGELLRLAGFDIVNDEFLFEYIRHNGFYIGKYSPTYFGTSRHLQLNKSPDNTQNIVSLSNYITTGAVSLVADGPKTSVARVAGVGSFSTKPMKMDSSIAYEVMFAFKYSGAGADFNVGIVTTDVAGYIKNTNSINTGAIQGNFVTSYAVPNTGVYYYFRGILHLYTEPLQASANDYLTNLGVGVNLRCKKDAQRVQIVVTNGGAGNLSIWDFKFRPLLNNKSNVFTSGTDMTRMWLRNRNFDLSSKVSSVRNITPEDVLEIKIREDLIPMGSALIRQAL